MPAPGGTAAPGERPGRRPPRRRSGNRTPRGCRSAAPAAARRRSAMSGPGRARGRSCGRGSRSDRRRPLPAPAASPHRRAARSARARLRPRDPCRPGNSAASPGIHRRRGSSDERRSRHGRCRRCGSVPRRSRRATCRSSGPGRSAGEGTSWLHRRCWWRMVEGDGRAANTASPAGSIRPFMLTDAP